MKKLILLVPFILMACGESASEKMEREYNEQKAKVEKEKAEGDAKIKELQEQMEADSIRQGINKY